MKKLLFALAGVLFVAGNAMSQDYEKNLYGVRIGMNVSNMSSTALMGKSKVGFHVAGSYQRLLTETMPLYLETGLQITQKGCKINPNKVNAMYLEIPVMINYKFNIMDVVTIYPSAGFYYAYAIGGSYKSNDYMDNNYTEKLFGPDNYLKRSDIGLRLCATVDWNQYSFGLGYEFGLLNIAQKEAFGSDNVKNGNFFITVGYNF